MMNHLLASVSQSALMGTVTPTNEHRYWRIYVLISQGNVQLSEVEFRDTIGGSNIATGGTALASDDYGGSYPAANAFDNDTGTKWAATDFGEQWIGYDFGSDVEIVEVYLNSASGVADERIYFGILQYSDDNITWHDYQFLPDPTPTPGSLIASTDTIAVSKNTITEENTTGAYKYWQLLFYQKDYNDSNNTYWIVEEIELLDSVGGTDLTGSGTATSSSDQSGSYPASNAFDGTTSIWATDNLNSPQWVQYEFSIAQTVNAMTLKARGSGSTSDRAPDGWLVRASSDGSNWTTIKDVRNQNLNYGDIASIDLT